MLTVKLHSGPDAERFFAQKLLLRDRFQFRCPKCRGFAPDTVLRGLFPCPLCAGKGRVEFQLTCELA